MQEVADRRVLVRVRWQIVPPSSVYLMEECVWRRCHPGTKCKAYNDG